MELNCKRINIFIGEPNTGKSNILEAIGLLSHAEYGHLSSFVRFESLLDIFYDRSLSDPISIIFDENALTIEFKDGCFVGNFLNSLQTPGAHPVKQNIHIFNYDYSGNPRPNLSSPGQIQWHMLNGERKKVLAQFKYYRFSRKESFVNQSSDFLLPPQGDNLLHIILTKKDLRGVISTLFKKYGYRIVFKPPEGKIEVQKEQEDVIVSIPYALSSETLQRITFYLAAIYSNKNSIISFEEPEAHAFPYYMKYLAEKISMDRVNNQYFIATHNPYFLMSIIEKTPKEDIATFATYFEEYQTKVKPLTQEETENALSMGADLFFNIDQFLGKIECEGN